MPKLILYDLMILRRGASAAFASKRDILLLMVVVPLLLTLIVRHAGQAAAALGDLHFGLRMALAAAAALIVNTAIAHRLAHLRDESVLARLALQAKAAGLHACFWNLIPLGIVTGLLALSAPPLEFCAVVLAYAAGGALAGLQGKAAAHLRAWARRSHGNRRTRSRDLFGATRRRRAVALLTHRSGLFGPALFANLLGLAATGAALVGLHFALSSQVSAPAALAIAGLPILLLFLAFLRVSPSLLRYLLYLGVQPTLPAIIASALAAALLTGAVAIALPVALASPYAILAAAASLFLLFAGIASLRTLHFATKPRSVAGLALQVEIAAIALIAYLAPPLAPVLLIARIWLLARDARTMRQLAR